MAINNTKAIKLFVQKTILIVFATFTGLAQEPSPVQAATDLKETEQASTIRQDTSTGQVGPSAPALTEGEQTVEMTRIFTHPKLQMTVLSGEINLPIKGAWRPIQSVPGSPLSNIFLTWHGLSLAPDAPERHRYTITGLLRGEIKEPVRIVLHDPFTKQKVTIKWDGRAMTAGDANLMTQWAEARLDTWLLMLGQPDSTVLQSWLNQSHELYGLSSTRWTDNRRERRTTNVFSVLGGRAAIRETLQMQAIGSQAGMTEDRESVPIDTIPGVQVKAHPFAEMLKGERGGNLSLANYVPHDHFFGYFAKPVALIGFLEGGSDFLARTGALMTQASVDNDLEAKYLSRLGLDRKWARTFLQSSAVTEVGVVLPDLFLLDGTELTVLMRVPRLALAQPLLQFLGIPDLKAGQSVPVQLKNGGTAYWALRGDLLVASTHAPTLDRVIQLYQAKGQGSLGQSAEFRYMLTRLPVQQSTVGYVYLSDPFIRNLVSPRTKIGQLRRMHAHAHLQSITAGALLYKADRQPGIPTLARLIELGYVPASLANPDYTLHEDGVANSARYGTLAKPASLLVNPVTHATSAEAAAYKEYLDQYNRFWRQFFDPIAIRLDETGAGNFELSTFILPLVESQLYNQVRAFVATLEKGKSLKVPSLNREPVLMLSLNLSQEGWKQVAHRFFSDFFWQFDRMLQDYFGPAHLAIADSDPIIALGSGDIIGVFGSDNMAVNGDWMFFISTMLSVLTWPSALVVELTDPQQVLMMLRQSPRYMNGSSSQVTVTWTRIEDHDAWVYNINIFNVVQLNFGVEVQGNYLIITNLPWSWHPSVTSTVAAPLNGALLQINPGAAQQQLPALHASAMAQERAAAMQSISYLYPLLISGSQTPEEAATVHANLFGFKPLHPASGEWLWQDGVLASSVFGTPRNLRQPEYQPDKRDFGMLPANMDPISVNMQFEDAGLRTVIRWSSRQTE